MGLEMKLDLDLEEKLRLLREVKTDSRQGARNKLWRQATLSRMRAKLDV